MESLSATSCQKVVASCLNFKCEILVTEKTLTKAPIMETHEKSIQLLYSSHHDNAEMEFVSNRCTDVGSFCSEDLERDRGPACTFFSIPKSELKVVELQLLELCSSSKLVKCLSMATRSLHRLSVTVY